MSVFGFAVALLMCMLSSKAVLASDDEYLRTLQEDYLQPQDPADISEYEQGNDSCVPNQDLTGFICNDVQLASADILGDRLVLKLDYSTDFNESSELFQTLGVVSASFAQVSDQVIANISFNSTTPNGTIVSQGRSRLEGIIIETGNAFFPTLPITVEIEHVAVLHRLLDEEIVCEEGEFCDNAIIHTDIGLFANGQDSNDRIKVTATVNEPNASHVVIPTSSRVTNGTMCSNLSYDMTFRDDLEADIEVCIQGLNCIDDDREFTPSNESRTIMSNQCFNRSETSLPS